MQDLRFIEYAPHRKKLVSFIWLMFVLAVLIAIGILFTVFWYNVVQYLPGLSFIVVHIKNAIVEVSLIGLFYAHLVGGLFFIPSPDEVIFYYALIKGNPILFSILFATAGYMLAQILNYFLGKKLSDPLLTLFSREKVYKARRTAQKYGALAVFMFNVLPFPGPVLSFALGITKYNFSRLMFWTVLGKVIKYGAVSVFFILTT
ncbi:MAG: YqaA family protein [Candidatus Pacearchaeota archaeon]